jgi:hypothetical protein
VNVLHICAKRFDLVSPDIWKLMKDEVFVPKMEEIEKKAWKSFKEVVQNFLSNHQSPNYKSLVEDMLINFKNLGCRMSVTVYFLNSHLDHFPENWRDVNEERGERFHQDIKEMERRYQGRWNMNVVADYCWMLKRDENAH